MTDAILTGRRVIFTDAEEITRENVADEVQKAFTVHSQNRQEIVYLYEYYKGKQPILNRIKNVRPEICNKIVENRANEIVSFKSGYLMGEPIQYVSRGDDKTVNDQITKLNGYMLSEDKHTLDLETADWMHICGTAYYIALPDKDAEVDGDEAPFEIFSLEPDNTFVVYQNSLGKPPMMGITYVNKKSNDGLDTTVFSVYTKDRYFEISSNGTTEYSVTDDRPNKLGIPIVEYPLNKARLGAFETVLPLLDAINITESNRVDGVEQFIQALMKFHNVDISSDDFDSLKEKGAIKYKDIDPSMKAEIDYLTAELNQDQTQTLIDHMYNTVLTICGMPNRNGGSSTSDTGTAVIFRDGWSAAESRAKRTEGMFKKSEKELLKIILKICNDLAGLNLKMSHLDIRFTRRNYENIAAKSQVLTGMLQNPKIHPLLAFTHCGMFSDPNLAYKMSDDYAKEQEEKALKLAKENGVNVNGNKTNGNPGSGAGTGKDPGQGQKR